MPPIWTWYATVNLCECYKILWDRLLMLQACYLVAIWDHLTTALHLERPACTTQTPWSVTATAWLGCLICHGTNLRSHCFQRKLSYLEINGYTVFMQHASIFCVQLQGPDRCNNMMRKVNPRNICWYFGLNSPFSPQNQQAKKWGGVTVASILVLDLYGGIAWFVVL